MQRYCHIFHYYYLAKIYYKITARQKTKPIDNKIEQNKTRHDGDTLTATVWLYHQEMLVNMNI